MRVFFLYILLGIPAPVYSSEEISLLDCGTDFSSSGDKDEIRELTRKIKALAEEGIPESIIRTFLDELQAPQSRAKWMSIGNELLASTRLTHLIESKATKVSSGLISLNRISTTHDITAPADVEKLRERIEELRGHSPEILRAGRLDSAFRQRIIRSESPVVRVARTPDGRCYVFDGNGRIQALRAAFGRRSDIEIEVTIYDIADPSVGQQIRESQRRQGGTDP